MKLSFRGVIEPSQIGWVLGWFLLALSALLLLPLIYAWIADDPSGLAFAKTDALTLVLAMGLLTLTRKRETRELKQREGIVLVVGIWFAICGLGALPFYFSPYFPNYTAAFFESASGFTTTGATVLDRLEEVPRAIHLWRCLTHWIGGLGIVLLGLAVLPLLGQGGMHLYRAEFSGAASQRLRPRLVETVQALWGIYLALTLALTLALRMAGMDFLEAICHAFSTLGTGGFSTRTASIADFHSPFIEYLLSLFMLLAGASFIQHYRVLVERQPSRVWRDFEVKAYGLIVSVATLVIMLNLAAHRGLSWELDWEKTFRDALFQVCSIISTTGFISDDFGLWPPLAQLLLVILMMVGGSTGSTSGGLKVARIVLLGAVVRREMQRMAEPQGVFSVRVHQKAVSEQTVHGLLSLVYLAGILLLLASLLVTATGVDVLTTVTAVVSCTFNVGPGLGAVGPAFSYSGLPDPAKWVLAFSMISGRLEFYTVLVLLTFSFWRR